MESHSATASCVNISEVKKAAHDDGRRTRGSKNDEGNRQADQLKEFDRPPAAIAGKTAGRESINIKLAVKRRNTTHPLENCAPLQPAATELR